MMSAEEDERFMRIALEEAAVAAAEGEVPVGAVMVRGGAVVAREHNRVEAAKRGSAHAELLCIDAASRALGYWRLDDCTLYVTKEPCPMCAGALVNCRVGRLVFGCGDPRMGAAGGCICITSMPGALHAVEVTQGVLADECLEMIRGFFRRRRKETEGSVADCDRI